MLEIYQLDLDDEILSHLAIPESVVALRDEGVSEELIQDEFTKNVFRWQNDHLHDHHSPATPSVLEDEFELSLSEPLTSVGDLIGRLRDRYMRNNARVQMESLADVYQKDPAAVPAYMMEAGRDLSKIVSKRGEIFGTGDFGRTISRYDKSVLAGPGPSLGFEALNDHFHGLKGVTFLLAAPKLYKSWINVNAVVDNVLQGRNVDLYSLELPADESDMRVRCLTAGVPYWKYLRGALNRDDRSLLSEASDFLDDTGRYRCIKPSPGQRSIESMVGKSRDDGAEAVFIDQLQYVEGKHGKQLGASDPQEYWGSLNTLRDLSDDGPIFMVHQFNRSVTGSDKMPEMQQAKGASSIEETATLVLGLWANKDMRKSNIVELGTLASRNYTFESWEIKVELSSGCDFQCLGTVDDEPEDD